MLIQDGMSRVRFGLAAALMALVATGCASTNQDESEIDREIASLRDENAKLRRGRDDVSAVEDAYERELKTKSGELARLRGESDRLRSENSQLRAENGRLRQQATQAAETPPRRETPVAVREVKTPSRAAPQVDLGQVGKSVEVADEGDGRLRLRVGASTMFGVASADLTAEGRKILDRIGDVLKRDRSIFISVEGHTDATPLGKSKAQWGTNMALSLARALEVQDYLKAKKGIAERRMRVVGYGEHRPIATGKSAKAMARNRRVELVLSNTSL